uniref:MRH domain-containing protein n=1 Tax=Strigamia maritima TaxID=126957 RepID=T1JC98_STRMM
ETSVYSISISVHHVVFHVLITIYKDIYLTVKMTIIYVNRNIFLLILNLSVLFYLTEANCIFGNGKYDLTVLDGPTPWYLHVENGSDLQLFQFSLCKPISIAGVCQKAKICQQKDDKNSVILAKGDDEPTFSSVSEDQGFWLEYLGPTCDFDTKRKLRTAINFQCSDKIGSPQFLYNSDCTFYFLWQTSASCDISKPKRKEVSCYVFDESGKKRDLSPLTLQNGFYEVTTSNPAIKFLINVCAAINDTTGNCTEGSGACRKTGSEVVNFGVPDTPLTWIDGNPTLYYSLEKLDKSEKIIPADCSSLPKTTITFRCPHDKDRDPRKTFSAVTSPSLTVTSNCDYQIEWVTEYACRVKELTSTQDCKLRQSDLGIDIDLNTLTLKDDKYNIHTTFNGQEIDFFLNVCGEVPNDICPNRMSACLKLKSENKAINIGSFDSKNLKFSDSELILSYKNGDKCPNGTNEHYSSVIIFQCGTERKPVFNRLIDCTYFFNWETKLACLDFATGSHCLARNQSKIVDLSSLVKHTGNWDAIITDVEAYTSSDIILNVCGTVNLDPNFTECAYGSAVCLKDMDKKFVNLGRFESEPKFIGNNAVIKYTNGDSCSSDSTKSISTLITFICEAGESNRGPSLISVSEDECDFEFEWKTSAGCVQSEHFGQDCHVFDQELGYSFDLTSLRDSGTFYVNGTDYDYYIRVCGQANEVSCKSLGSYAICQVTKSDKPSKFVWNLGLPSSYISYFDGFINLTYIGGTPYNDKKKTPRQSSISFLCDPDAGKGHPEFVSEENQIYNFKWYTSLACPQRPIPCVPCHGFGESLIQKSGSDNWEVVAEFNSSRKKFYLNVCRPLVGTVDGCDSETSSCVKTLVDGKEKDFVSDAGRVIGKPKIEKGEKIITLKYDMGEECIGSGLEKKYSTVISLYCDNESSVLKPPQFLKLLGKCKFHFMWPTRAACPIQLDSTISSNCEIIDSSMGLHYDLQPLRDVYSIKSLPGLPFSSIELSLCGAELKYSCHGSRNVSVCGKEKNSKKDKVLGVTTHAKIEMGESGRITIRYSKQSPIDLGKQNYVIIINLNCKPDVRKGEMKFVRLQDKVYYFEMDTNVACAPKQIQCATWDSAGNEYDLSSLVRSNTNWEVIDSRPHHNDLRYYINVCKPLYLGDAHLNSKCEVGAAGCQLTGDGRSFSLGIVGAAPHIMSTGQLVLKYRDGSPCHGGKFNRSVKILFECSYIQHDPVFVDETPECEYIIIWSTPAACPIKRAIGAGCHVDDTQFGHRFDLSPLKQMGPMVVEGKDHSYMLAVCKNVECNGMENVGVCQKADKREINAGLFNEKLLFNDGELSLEYSDGEANCHGQYSRSSIIKFKCAPSELGTAVFVGESNNCSYVFLWETNLACAPVTRTQCSIRHKGKMYDLSSLTLYNQSHEVVSADGKQKFLINVCRSLAQSKESRCQYTSGVCRVDLMEEDPKLKFKNIGNVHEGPYFEQEYLKVKYQFGENCQSGPSEAIITFYCDRSKMDTEPQFLRQEGCVWHFMWSTPAACPIESEEILSNDCTVVNPESGFQFNLKSLSNSSGYIVEDMFKTHKYTINVCDNLPKSACGSDVGSCQEDTSNNRYWNTGKANSKLHYHNGIILLNYTDGTACHKGMFNRSTIIQFICSPGSGKGEISFMEETNNCTYYFIWHTELACENLVHCMADSGSHVIDLSTLMRTDNYLAQQSDINNEDVYLISVCRPLNPVPAFPCPPESAACQTAIGHSKPTSLGQVMQSPEVDEQGRVYLMYTHGSECPSKPHTRISSKIIFICRENAGTGTPKLMDKSEDCVYTFEWQTDIVCSNNSSMKLVNSENCVFTDTKTQMIYDLKNIAETVKMKDDDISINVCGAISDSGPCAGSSICQGDKTSYGSASSVTSFITQENTLRIHFSNGSDCKDKKNLNSEMKKWASEIWFT